MGIYEIMFKNNLSKVNKKLNAMKKTLKDINTQSNEVKNNFKRMIDNSPFGFIQSKMDGLNETFKGSSYYLKLMGMPFKQLSQNFSFARKGGMGLFSSLKKGLMGFLGASKFVFSMLLKKAAILAIAFFKITIPLLAIAGIFYMLKKVWDTNIGGIQTKFNQVFGRIKSAWGKFNIELIKTLQKFGPMLSNLFDTVLDTFESMIPTIKFFAKLTLGTVKLLLPVMVRLTKVGLMPIRIIFKAINATVEGTKKLFEWFKSSKAFDPTVKTLKWIANIWSVIRKAIIEFGDSLPKWAQKLIGFDKMTFEQAPAAETNNRPSISNNNTDNKTITIMTNQQINEKGAANFKQILQQQSFLGV